MKKRLTKAKREERDGRMEKIKWARILVVRRLIKEGWDNRQLSVTWDFMEKELVKLVRSHSKPDHHWCCEVEISDILIEKMLEFKFESWGDVKIQRSK